MSFMTRRILMLAGIITVGFCGIFLLPDIKPMRPSRMAVELPAELGGWESRKVAISERELSVLAEDTNFERRVYNQKYESSLPPVEASVVFSGKDMNNSIHRPEVCLRTQGWSFARERYVTVSGALPGGESVLMREILCNKIRRNPDTGQPQLLPNGKILVDWQILYYTFVGARDVTASHYGRVFRDIRDRIFGGFDQQWAYATFSSIVPGEYQKQGVDLGTMDPLGRDQTGAHLTEFIRKVMPQVLDQPDRNL